MAIMHTQPLGCIMAYDPTFKVDVSQHDPLHKLGMTERDILLDVMAVSAQLDLLFRKELSNSEKDRIDNGKVSRSFETKAMVMLKRVKTYIKRLPAPQPTPEDYVEISGLAKLYPRAATFVTRPNELSKASKSTNMDSYYAYLGNIHQLTTLAHQINSDVTNLVNHKYIAHQMVLLHQALGLFADNTILADLRKQIERNFEILKTTLTPEKEHEEVCLSSQHAQWVLDVTSSIVHEATSLPQNVAPKLFLPAQVLLNAS